MAAVAKKTREDGLVIEQFKEHHSSEDKYN
jgi:hypothetical protein